MEAISVTARIISSLGESSLSSAKFVGIYAINTESRNTSKQISTSHGKMCQWQDNWPNQSLTSNVSAKNLWGIEGWTTVEGLLDKIMRTLEEIALLLQPEKQDYEAESVLQKLKKWIKDEPAKEIRFNHQTPLEESVKTLEKFIDELSIRSESLFASIHGPPATASKFSDSLVTFAIHLRKAAVLLFEMLLVRPEDCNLEMTLLDHGMASKSVEGGTETTPILTYRLLFESSERELRKFAAQYTPETQLSDAEIATAIEPDAHSTPFGPLSPPKTIIKVPYLATGPKHYLTIAKAHPHPIPLLTPPPTLFEILQGMQQHGRSKPPAAYSKPNAKILDVNAKVNLALKLAECTFFLLGTPWFSWLSSKNLRTCNRTEDGRLGFMLRVQALEYQDLLGDDHNALAERRQLWRLGVILMNIALNISYTGDSAEDGEIPGVDSIMLDHNGPLVQSAMGERYYDAMVFCFRHRRDGFKGPEKYEEKGRAKWEAYLTRLLGDFYRCVYLK